MSIRLKFFLIIVVAVLASLGGCSAYKSSGRKCVETGCESFKAKTTTATLLGLSEKFCHPQGPKFHEKLNALYETTENTPKGLATYFDFNNNRPAIVIVEEPQNTRETGNYCRFVFQNQIELEENFPTKIELAARLLDWLTFQKTIQENL